MSAATPDDIRWLDAAARIATPWLGTTGETPTVGALVVDENRQVVIARGVTARGGRPHAEPQALQAAGGRARGRTLYVTLEPCHHWGRTPPCADAVVRSGIRRVVIGVVDPDPRTAGDGIRRMRAAGLDVVVADHPGSIRLHEGFLSRHQRGRPFVTARLAVSADGKIGLRDQPRVAVAGEAVRRWAHMERALSGAVMVGAETARLDDPQLTVRLPGLEERSHLRVVVVGSRPFDPGIRMIADVSPLPTAVILPEGRAISVPPTVDVIEVPARNGRPDLAAALRALSARGVGRLLVEGGAVLCEALLAADLVDRFHLVTSPRVIGAHGVPATLLGGLDGRVVAAGLVEVDRRQLGEDNLRTFERP